MPERASVQRWAVAVVFALAAAAIVWTMYDRHPMARLARAVPDEARVVTARLSSFAWAPLADADRSGAPRAVRIQIMGAAGAAMTELRGDDRAESRHAYAVAYLLAGHATDAVRTFEQIAPKDRTAAQWSDLAAAHLSLAERSDSLDELTDALVAVDDALRLEPALPEALFNRALILERFALRDAAASAWKAYLAADATTDWADEARARLAKLDVPLPTVEAELARLEPRLARGEREAARAVVQIDAGDARYVAQTEGLAQWAEAWLRGDDAEAERKLAVVRAVGDAITLANGEPTLAGAVAAIDKTQGEARRALALGHVAFRDGRLAFRPKRNFAESEKLLSEAAREFDKAQSPMAGHARFFRAVAIQSQGRTAEAEAALVALATTEPVAAAALHGYVDWQRASCFMARAEWGAALRHLEKAIEQFDALHEASHTAYLHDIVSQVYDAIGDRERSRRSRMLALRHHGARSTNRLEHAIAGMVYDASRRKLWRAARSFLDVEVEVARRVRDPEMQTNVLLRRALVSMRLGQAADARADVRDAGASAAAVVDPRLRKKLETDRDTTAALIEEDPALAVSRLSEVLRVHATDQGWRMLLPDLYLRRGRMYLRLADRQRAARDFESGIAELEKHRESLPAGEARWGVLDAADELFDEAVEISLPEGAARAFAYAERERARSLSDGGNGTAFDSAAMNPDSAIVEYAVLPRKLVIFAVDRTGYQMTEREIARDDLSFLVQKLRLAVHDGAPERLSLAREVYEVLIAPVAHALTGKREVLLVPDSVTAGVPFGALIDPRTSRTLADEYLLSIQPSARFAQARKPSALVPRRKVLVVADPVSDDLERLPGAAAEAAAIASMYDDNRKLIGHDATVDAFVDEVPHADVIHFAGHGILSRDSAALVLTSSSGDVGSLDMKSVSRLQVRPTAVVVVAACDSSRGPAQEERALGVAYAFLQAGAPAVIATLWPISDHEAAVFFPRLHRHLAAGMPPAEALRATQLEFARKRSGKGRSFWAAVQCIGC